ncbi:hypothetical protein HN587_01815 [Candidatus Woesearchaeota archaeon]|nr:hypothetical protein [Candidatus Woesearchaeota archaeon]
MTLTDMLKTAKDYVITKATEYLHKVAQPIPGVIPKPVQIGTLPREQYTPKDQYESRGVPRQYDGRRM